LENIQKDSLSEGAHTGVGYEGALTIN
jgi:hypothetical protein